MINYGALIKEIREVKQLTQKELADICNVSQAAIQKLETGVNASPSIEIVSALVIKLKVNPYAFIYPNQKPLFADIIGNETKIIKNKLDKLEKHVKAMHELFSGGK